MGALIWLASYPKSGNTWMRIFLLNLLRDRDEPLDINKMAGLSPMDSARVWYEPFARAPLDRLSEPEIAKLLPLGHKRITEIRPDPVLVKTHNFFGNWRGVPLHTGAVSAGAIYIVRNPLDVAISVRGHFGMSDLDRAIAYIANENVGARMTDERMPEFYRSWSGHVRSWTERPSPKIQVVRYEDLVAAPETHFARVARILGIPASDAQIERAIRFSAFDRLQKQEAEQGFIERPEKSESFFRGGKSGAWRDVLTPEQVTRIVADHREQMARFGYIPEGY
ncbi:sulfotransferase domain-containing protein [Parvibaculum sp.]|uniref:sulfotransferase domain-containing protein n=1 Tax=Parvibaculum sp. TaxID=2024848 RepID=UPI00391DD9CC